MKTPTNIPNILSRLNKIISTPGNNIHFSSPANELKINIFQKMNGIQLPKSFKSFLLKYNGGMMVYDYQDEFIRTQADFELYKKESVYLLSIDEISEMYSQMLMLAHHRGNNTSPYPFIPFCTLPDKKFLLFVNLPEHLMESPVFLGCHNKSEKFWRWVSSDFSHFLEYYLDEKGHPEISFHDTKENAQSFFQTNGSNILQTDIDLLGALTAKERAHYYYEQAQKFNKLGKHFNSWELISKAINEDPNAFYYFFRAEILNKTKQYRAALIDYDNALKLEPENSFYWCCRAEVFTQLNKLYEALEDCKQALQIDSKNTLAYFLRKQIYLKLGEPYLAEKDQQTIDELESY